MVRNSVLQPLSRLLVDRTVELGFTYKGCLNMHSLLPFSIMALPFFYRESLSKKLNILLSTVHMTEHRSPSKNVIKSNDEY